MCKLESRNLSTQFTKQLSSALERLVEGFEDMHLSQHRSVKRCIEACNFAWACSLSIKDVSSFCVTWSKCKLSDIVTVS